MFYHFIAIINEITYCDLFVFFFSHQNKTRGLLGTWTWDMSDDLTLPDGRIVGANLNNFEGIHRDFAINC